jgi:hypothetical protein
MDLRSPEWQRGLAWRDRGCSLGRVAAPGSGLARSDRNRHAAVRHQRLAGDERAGIAGHRVVDQDVEMAVLRRDRVDGGIGIGTRADVERGDAGLSAGTGDLLLARLQALEIPAIENHMGAGQRQTRRHAGTQAARGTGDQGDTALQ